MSLLLLCLVNCVLLCHRDEDAPNEVLISWDDAVKRCIPFNDLEGLQYLRADSGSTLEDDLLYGTSELLNQYEVGWDDFETGEDDPTMDGTASLPARYPSSYSGRKYAAKVSHTRRERERERVCVCVRERERERERVRDRGMGG